MFLSESYLSILVTHAMSRPASNAATAIRTRIFQKTDRLGAAQKHNAEAKMQFWFTLRISSNCNDPPDSPTDFRHCRRVLDQAAASDAKANTAPAACPVPVALFGESRPGQASNKPPTTSPPTRQGRRRFARPIRADPELHAKVVIRTLKTWGEAARAETEQRPPISCQLHPSISQDEFCVTRHISCYREPEFEPGRICNTHGISCYDEPHQNRS